MAWKGFLVKGVSVLLAAVIVLALAIVLSVAVIGWVSGLIGSSARAELLLVKPYSYIDASTGVLHLHVVNKGTDNVMVYRIEVLGLGECRLGEPITLGLGEDTSIICTVYGADGGLVRVEPRKVFTVKLYTKSGNVFVTVVEAK